MRFSFLWFYTGKQRHQLTDSYMILLQLLIIFAKKETEERLIVNRRENVKEKMNPENANEVDDIKSY